MHNRKGKSAPRSQRKYECVKEKKIFRRCECAKVDDSVRAGFNWCAGGGRINRETHLRSTLLGAPVSTGASERERGQRALTAPTSANSANKRKQAPTAPTAPAHANKRLHHQRHHVIWSPHHNSKFPSASNLWGLEIINNNKYRKTRCLINSAPDFSRSG